jgi:hypothetical protein
MALSLRKRRHRLRCWNEKKGDGGIGDAGLCGKYGGACARWEMIWLLRCVRGGEAVHVAAAGRAVFEDDQFGVQIVGERDDEKEQNEGAGDRGPFAPRSMAAGARLMRPAGAPEGDSACGE